MSERVSILINRTARESVAQKVINLGIQEARISDLTYPVQIPETTKATIVVGGDGSVRSVMEALLERDEPGRLLVVKGGSQNGTYEALKGEKVIFRAQEFALGTSKTPMYSPGLVNGKLFHHGAGTGFFEVRQAIENERIRRSTTPRPLQAYAAVYRTMAAALRADAPKKRFVRTFLTSRYVGPLQVLPKQKQPLFGDEITMVETEGDLVVARFFLALLYALNRKTPPSQFATVTTSREFVTKADSTTANLDGEVVDIFSREIKVSRSKKGIKMAALRV
jgi:diacylglycerol kinase family enzyme